MTKWDLTFCLRSRQESPVFNASQVIHAFPKYGFPTCQFLSQARFSPRLYTTCESYLPMKRPIFTEFREHRVRTKRIADIIEFRLTTGRQHEVYHSARVFVSWLIPAMQN